MEFGMRLDWSNTNGKMYDKENPMKQLLQVYQRILPTSSSLAAAAASAVPSEETTKTLSNTSTTYCYDSGCCAATKVESNDNDSNINNNNHHNSNNNNELVFIVGPCGVGKTKLAQSLRQQAEADGGCFVQGKFEQPQQPQQPVDLETTTLTEPIIATTPITATAITTLASNTAASSRQSNSYFMDRAHGPVAEAFSQYASFVTKVMQQQHPVHKQQLTTLLQTALEQELDTSELQVLADSIPALQCIVQPSIRRAHARTVATVATTTTADPNDTNHNHPTSPSSARRGSQGPDAEKCYHHILSKFVTAIRVASSSSTSASAKQVSQGPFHDDDDGDDWNKDNVDDEPYHTTGDDGCAPSWSSSSTISTTPPPRLVMLLDDVQSADARSLQMLQFMLTRKCSNPAVKGILIICTVRTHNATTTTTTTSTSKQSGYDQPKDGDDASSPSSSPHLLPPRLETLLCNELRKTGGVTVTQISLDNWREEVVRELVTDLLLLPCNNRSLKNQPLPSPLLPDTRSRQQLVHQLTRMVHQTTQGNALFTLQLLRHWELQGQLQKMIMNFNPTTTTTLVPCIASTNFVSSVHALVAQRIQALPPHVQDVLKMASCMGSNITTRLLIEAGSVGLTPLDVPPALTMACEIGLMIDHDHHQDEFDAGIKATTSSTRTRNSPHPRQQQVTSDINCSPSVSFVHDVIQQVAYSLIPEQARPALHLHIGRALWVWLSYDELETHMFLVTNQIIRGLHLVDDQVEKEELAQLFYRAGQKAAKSSVFSQACRYFESGMALLGRKNWKRHYRLSLDLYNAAAEVEYYVGNLTRVNFLLSSILKHGRSLDDQVQARFTQIYSLASGDEMNQAFSVGLDLLHQLGVTFPRRLLGLRNRWEWQQCLRRLRRMNDDSILRLALMQDNRNLIIFRLLNTLLMSAVTERQEFVTPLVIRMVCHTLSHGISGASCVGFAYLGSQMGRRGRLEDGRRFVNLGLQIMERFDAKEWQSCLALGVYGGFYTIQHPVRESIKPLLAARRAGLVVGDIHSSWVCAVLQARVSLCAGVPLPELLDDLRKCRKVSVQCDLASCDMILSHQEQLYHNFMGKAHDPITLTGDAINEVETIRSLRDKHHPVTLAWLLLMKHMLAVYFGEYHVARDVANQFRAIKGVSILEVSLITHQFLEGMTAAALSRTNKVEKLRASQLLKLLSPYKYISSANFSNKISLVEAEIAAANDELPVALVKYEESIAAANREGFLHEQALACERAGLLLLHWGRIRDGQEYLRQSCHLYQQWGASAKVAFVKLHMERFSIESIAN